MGLKNSAATISQENDWITKYCDLLQAEIRVTDQGVYAVAKGTSLPEKPGDEEEELLPHLENEHNLQRFDFDFSEKRYERNRALAEAVYHVWSEQLLTKQISNVRLFIVDELTPIVTEDDVLIRQELIPTVRMFSRDGAETLDEIYNEDLIRKGYVLDLATLEYMPRQERRARG